MDSIFDTLKERFDQHLEAKKEQGGFFGVVATAVDFLGDDVLGMWGEDEEPDSELVSGGEGFDAR